jgi:uncharacterized protein with PIN domain
VSLVTLWFARLSCGYSWTGVLAPVPKHEVEQLLRPGTRRSYDSFARCRSCGHIYWRGAHAARLAALVDSARLVVDASTWTGR